jgi:hypothetical protein
LLLSSVELPDLPRVVVPLALPDVVEEPRPVVLEVLPVAVFPFAEDEEPMEPLFAEPERLPVVEPEFLDVVDDAPVLELPVVDELPIP